MKMHPSLTDPALWTDKYQKYLYKIAIGRLNDTEAAKDMVQDTFLAALEKMNSFKGNSSEKTWLTSILLNKVTDCYRKGAMEKSKVSQISSSILYNDSCKTTEDLIITKEFFYLLDHKLLELPHLWALVFKLKYLDGQPTTLICAQLNITPSNFWTISHRSKLKLRDCFRKAE